ncbi:Serine/arginine repetitive matrix protein 1 [Taenia solium]|eukprot:TsM_000851200 transcript=TsM_000851200 gene=TsM_000851200
MKLLIQFVADELTIASSMVIGCKVGGVAFLTSNFKMTDAGFFKGTNTDQDSRFTDKKKKLLKSMKFGDNLNEKVDTQRVNVESIKPWIVKRITELLSYEDDIVCDFVVNMLSDQFPDPKEIQINLTAFLGSKSARIFVTELWDLLLSAMNTTGGVPAILLEARKAELLGSKVRNRENMVTWLFSCLNIS